LNQTLGFGLSDLRGAGAVRAHDLDRGTVEARDATGGVDVIGGENGARIHLQTIGGQATGERVDRADLDGLDGDCFFSGLLGGLFGRLFFDGLLRRRLGGLLCCVAVRVAPGGARGKDEGETG